MSLMSKAWTAYWNGKAEEERQATEFHLTSAERSQVLFVENAAALAKWLRRVMTLNVTLEQVLANGAKEQHDDHSASVAWWAEDGSTFTAATTTWVEVTLPNGRRKGNPKSLQDLGEGLADADTLTWREESR